MSELVSNGVGVAPLDCENCSVRPAVATIRFPRKLNVCGSCLAANDGRFGWPYFADVRAQVDRWAGLSAGSAPESAAGSPDESTLRIVVSVEHEPPLLLGTLMPALPALPDDENIVRYFDSGPDEEEKIAPADCVEIGDVPVCARAGSRGRCVMGALHYVILSVDAMPDTAASDSCLQPPRVGTWTQTEGDEQFDYEYLGPEYIGGRHRKWVAELTEDELDRWLSAEEYGSREEARAKGEPTMGMLTELGHLPAYALHDQPMDWNVGGVTQVVERQAYVGEYALAAEGEIPAAALAALTELYGLEGGA